MTDRERNNGPARDFSREAHRPESDLRKAAYRKGRCASTPRSPLGGQRARLKDEAEPVRLVLTEVFGESIASDFLEAACRVELRDVKSEIRRRGAPSMKHPEGKLFAPPRTAVAQFTAAPVRSENSKPVRTMALLLLTVIETFEPEQRQKAARALYMGRLAIRLKTSTRELQRFIAVLRAANILEAWQPPKESASLRSAKGRAYNVWFLMRDQPRELVEQLAAWRDKYKAQQGAESRARAVAPTPPATRTPRADGGALAARLLASVLGDVPPS